MRLAAWLGPARTLWVRCFGCASLLLAQACGTVLGIDDLVADREPSGAGASGGGTGTGGALCFGACGSPGCGDCPDAPRVQASSPAGPYFIDANEVTIAEYNAWLATKPSLAGQRKECAWNDSFQPNVTSQQAIEESEAAGIPYESDPSCALEPPTDQRPISCVDWCDASAYCTWAGRRLCGAIGGGIIELDVEGEHADAEQSEWFRACSNEGTQAYPYAGPFNPDACNDDNSGLKDVDAYEECEGGLPGLFNMSGNVAEWEDACTFYDNPDSVQNCLVRGGTWYNLNETEQLACAAFRDLQRLNLGTAAGIRCCSDG